MHILIISYYYPPCNTIASLRPYSWAKNWSKQGHNITVITRNWTEKDKSWDDFLSSSSSKTENIHKSKNCKLVQVPYIKQKYSSNKINRRKSTLLNTLKGNFHIEIDTEQFRTPCENEIKINKPDLIIVTAPPLNLVKLGYDLSKKSKINFAVDFRDYENFSTLKINPSNNFWTKLDLKIKNLYLKKWLTNAVTVSVATEEFSTYFKKNNITNNAKEFTNGYEAEIFDTINNTSDNNFTIAILGTIFPDQNSSCFINGFNLFTKENPDAKIKINFIGGSSLKKVADYWSDKINATELHITPRIERALALQIGKNANILFYPGWKGYKGMYSGKIFDYLGLRKNILIAPNDNNVLDKLILKTKAGVIKNSAIEIKELLTDWYYKWENNEPIPYNGIESEIIKYSRENIAISLLKEIENSIDNK